MIPVAEVIQEVRHQMRDFDTDDLAIEDRMILDGINHTVQSILKIKPILAWIDTHTYQAPSAFRVVAAVDTVKLPEDWREAIVTGACAWLCGHLDADQGMAQAQQRFAARFAQAAQL